MNSAVSASHDRWFVRTLLQRVRTKGWIAAVALQLFICNIATADGLRLLLAPSETAIKPRSTVPLTVYLYNTGMSPKEVPSLELLAVTFTIDDLTGKRLGRVGGTKEISTGPAKKLILKAHAVDQRTVNVEVPADPGDLVKVYAELGKKPVLRSNSVLLFCPPEAKSQ
jgi:hypothetical protein